MLVPMPLSHGSHMIISPLSAHSDWKNPVGVMKENQRSPSARRRNSIGVYRDTSTMLFSWGTVANIIDS